MVLELFLQFAVAHGIIADEAELDAASHRSQEEAQHKKKGPQNLSQE